MPLLLVHRTILSCASRMLKKFFRCFFVIPVQTGIQCLLLGLYLKSKGYELTFAENGLDTSQSSPVEISIWYSLTSTCPTWTDWSSSGI
jgi:hypothetical protein